MMKVYSASTFDCIVHDCLQLISSYLMNFSLTRRANYVRFWVYARTHVCLTHVLHRFYYSASFPRVYETGFYRIIDVHVQL